MSIDWNKPIQSRDGRPARVVCTNKKGARRPIVALVADANGCEHPVSCRRDGRLYDDIETGLDIINVSERVERWMNLFPCSVGQYLFESEEKAARCRPVKPAAVLKITFENDKPVAVELVEP